MKPIVMDAYVLDVLMPDLIGHDRRPAAFIVYLFLLRQASITGRDTVAVSLQTIATKTGLSKSTVQTSLRHLRRRRLLDPAVVATVSNPMRGVLRPWARPKSIGQENRVGRR
jgi:helix-turn-helix protein